MTKYFIHESIIGLSTEIPSPDNPTGGTSDVATTIYIESDTGDIKLSTGQSWQIIGQLPIGALPSGVTSPQVGFLTVDQLEAQDIKLDSTAGSTLIDPGRINFTRSNDAIVALSIVLAAGSSGAEMVLNDHTGALLWEIDADGSELLAAGLGRFGHAAPPAASVLSGALSAVTDPAAKAVLTSIIAALTADGGATDSTT